MPRRGYVEKREIYADSVFGSKTVAKFINKLIFCGKKSVAEKIFYGALDLLKEKTKKEPLEIFNSALKNVTPLMEVKPRRVGGATYQIPMEVKRDRGFSLAIRWIIRSARLRKGKPMKIKLFEEMFDAFNNTGGAVKKREEVHKAAESNKAFAHFRW